jgi:multidrug efflux pump subunit AcrA (membrane-fusion protein)
VTLKKAEETIMKMNIKWVILAAIVAVGAAGCTANRSTAAKTSTTKNGTSAVQQAVSVFAVNTTTVSVGDISNYISLSGDLVASSTVETYSDAAGKIISRSINIGSYVKKGQVIMQVDPSKPGLYYRFYNPVKAPITGVITSLPAEVGMTINTTTPLAEISSRGGGVEVKLYVPERFVPAIQKGLVCQITLDAYPSDVFRGMIYEIAPSLDVASRTMMVKVTVDNTSDLLKPGMFANVSIVTQSKKHALKIPESAIVNRGGQSVVFVVTPDPTGAGQDIARQVTVQTGIIVDNVAEIDDGLEKGDVIVSKGQSLLADGAHINVIGQDKPVGAEDVLAILNERPGVLSKDSASSATTTSNNEAAQ